MTKLFDEAQKIRTSEFPIQSFLLNRWSPRSMTGEPMTDEELMPLFEAARWAPSAFNEQPWKILYGKRDTDKWDLFYNLLIDFNKEWCKNASALVLFVSRNTFEKNQKPSPTHSYDTGAAWMAMALEGAARNLVVHGMSGFDFEKARIDLQVPEGCTVEAMAAIGKLAPKENLPGPIQEREAPSSRRPLAEIISEGVYT